MLTALARPLPDLRDVDKMTFDFDLGKPFHPFEQLMGVLPAASQSHIPEAFRVRRAASWQPGGTRLTSLVGPFGRSS